MASHDTGSGGAGRFGLAILGALALLAAAAGWLWLTRTDPPRVGRNFFGAWRTMPILVAIGLAWLALGAFAFRSRQSLFRWLLVTLLGGLTWILLEGLSLARAVDYRELFGTEIHAGFGGEPTPHQTLAATTYPDIASAWGLPSEPIAVNFRSDQRGYRNAEDRDDADVYLLGDSILVAGLLPWENTVAARLERELEQSVMNLALIGVGPQRELQMLEEAQLPLDGRVVLQFVTEANDIGDSKRFRNQNAGGTERASIGDRSFVKNAMFWLQKRLQPVPYEASELRGTYRDQDYLFLWVGDSVTAADESATESANREAIAAELNEIKKTLAATREFVHANGGRYGVVLVPSKYRVMYPPAHGPTARRYATRMRTSARSETKSPSGRWRRRSRCWI